MLHSGNMFLFRVFLGNQMYTFKQAKTKKNICKVQEVQYMFGHLAVLQKHLKVYQLKI